MTDIVARGHGGDGHGDPPPGGWNPPSGCAASGSSIKRGATKNKGLRARWEKNGCNPFPITFDFEDQGTMRPVGQNAKDFKALLGVTLRTTVPLTHDSWSGVPKEAKTAIWPQLQTYFDLTPYLNHPGLRTPFENGIMKLCAELYSGSKYHFKNKHFTKLGGKDNVHAIRRTIPPNMTNQTWNELVDFYCRSDNVHRSTVNSSNRAHHNYPSYHGTKSYVETRFDRNRVLGHYPSLIEGFREHHSRNGTIPLPVLAQQQYDHMNELLRQQEGAANPMTEEQILAEVLGTRSGFNRGRGHIVPGMARYQSSSSSPGKSSNTVGRVYTQGEVDAIMAKSERTQAHLSSNPGYRERFTLRKKKPAAAPGDFGDFDEPQAPYSFFITNHHRRNDDTVQPENAGPIQVWYNNHYLSNPNDAGLIEDLRRIEEMRDIMRANGAREDCSIDEVECLRRLLGTRRGFQPGIGTTVSEQGFKVICDVFLSFKKDHMNELLRQQEGAANPMTEEQILAEVLGTRSGFNRGRGHIVPGMARYQSSSSSPGKSSNTMGRVYTQAEVDAIMAKSERTQAHLSSQIQAIVKGLSQNNIEIEWEEKDQNDDESSD